MTAVVVYPLIIAVVLAVADIVAFDRLAGVGSTRMWVLTSVFAIGGVANAASRSKVERIWSPVSFGIAVCCGYIARVM